jgi:5-methyltetrahydropteroyltriglutamate--homocysteine methyltransferase
VGSLIRPQAIVEMMPAIENGLPYDEQEFARTLQDAVSSVIQTQAEIGIDIPSDGEYGKRGWFQYVSERFEGLEYQEHSTGANPRRMGGRERARFAEFFDLYERIERRLWQPETMPEHQLSTLDRRPGTWVCTGPIRYKGHGVLQRDIENLRGALAEVQAEEAFIPVVAPCTLEVGYPNRYYPSDEEYLAAIAAALREEYRAIIEAGFLLQIDDAMLPAQYYHSFSNEKLDEYRRWASVRIDALNHALEGIPPDQVRYHFCWGSQNMPHTVDVPLQDIVDIVLEANVGGHSIEASNPRHEHEWQVWHDVKLPDWKVLIPGLVSHATNIVEHPDLIAWRIRNFASVVGREQIIASTDCGFAQNWAVRRVHPTIQWAKLGALVEGARRASKQLW